MDRWYKDNMSKLLGWKFTKFYIERGKYNIFTFMPNEPISNSINVFINVLNVLTFSYVVATAVLAFGLFNFDFKFSLFTIL